MKLCKCIKYDYLTIGIIKDEFYYYKIISGNYLSHIVFDKKNKWILDMYTGDQFRKMFIDIREERKLKLKQINENRR